MRRQDIIKELNDLNLKMNVNLSVNDMLNELKKLNNNITVEKLLSMNEDEKFMMNYTKENNRDLATVEWLLSIVLIRLCDLKKFDKFTKWAYLDLKKIYVELKKVV